jgi:hypothetical protein
VAVLGLKNQAVTTIPGVAGVTFVLDATGQMTSISNPVAAQAHGNTLTFATVDIHVDPTTYTRTYNVSNYGNLSGPSDLVLVPGLLWQVAAGSQGGSIIPYPDQVIPPVLTLTIEGESHRFVFTVGAKPIANAGPDQTVDEGAIVTLDGSQSSVPPGGSVLYVWRQLAEPLVILDRSDPARPRFRVPDVSRGGAVLTFELVVTNGQLTSDPDTVDITVKNVNNAPVADAGVSQAVKEESVVVLDGTHSFDPDSDNLIYRWVQISGPPVALSDPMVIQPFFMAPLVGPLGEELIFQLTVDDGEASDMSETRVTVEHINHAPSANAGMDQTVNEGSLVILDGTVSSDPDNDPLTYTWLQLHGTPVQISDPYMASLAFAAPPQLSHSQETLIFRLEVNDGEGGTASDEVSITVLDVNALPECDLAQASPALLWPPNHKLMAVRILGVMDPNNDQVTLTVREVTQDEPVEGQGDGDSSPDAVLQGDTTLLRAERAGQGNGRVYRISFTADDGHGGSCTGAVTVCVPHDRRPGTCVDGGQQYDATQP